MRSIYVLYDINRMSGNPLYVFKLARGFYSTLASLLPLYNLYTFFISITRSIPRKLFLKFFPSFDIDMLRRLGISFDTVNACQDVDYTLYVHSRDSVSNNILFFTNVV